jgi:hypothetical protein
VREFAPQMHVAHEDRSDALHRVPESEAGRKRGRGNARPLAVPLQSLAALSLAARTVAIDCEASISAAGI